jgi:steroid delta-isomerase-like uncharacterized protein
MSAQENASLVLKSLDAFNARDFGPVLTAAVADDVEIVDLPRGVTQHGSAGFNQFHQDLHEGFPNTRMTVTNLQATDQQVFVEFKCNGQNTGRFGLIPATGNTVNMQFAGIYEISNGKIVKVRFYYDGASVFQQLGVRLG